LGQSEGRVDWVKSHEIGGGGEVGGDGEHDDPRLGSASQGQSNGAILVGVGLVVVALSPPDAWARSDADADAVQKSWDGADAQLRRGEVSTASMAGYRQALQVKDSPTVPPSSPSATSSPPDTWARIRPTPSPCKSPGTTPSPGVGLAAASG